LSRLGTRVIWGDAEFADEHKQDKQVESLTTYFSLSSAIHSDGSRGLQVIKQKAQVRTTEVSVRERE
jgi:hypothetical protein